MIAPAATLRRRERLVQAETVKEHLWRLLLDWPQAITRDDERAARAGAAASSSAAPSLIYPHPQTPAMAQVMQCFLRARHQPASHSEPFRLGARVVDASGAITPTVVGSGLAAEATFATACGDLAALVREHALQTAPADWLATVNATEALLRWADTTPAPPAQLVRTLVAEGRADCGANAVKSLAALPMEDLAQGLAGADAVALIAVPQWQGRCWETGPLGRAARHPLVADVLAEFGNGLLAHLAALLVELAKAAAILESAEPEAPATRPGDAAYRAERANADLGGAVHTRVADNLDTETDTAADTGNAGAITSGVALAEAARGALLHRVEIADAVVQRYQILAPTEWNFHPEGVVAQGLAGIAHSGVGGAELERLARLYITAVDPCVAYRLSVS